MSIILKLKKKKKDRICNSAGQTVLEFKAKGKISPTDPNRLLCNFFPLKAVPGVITVIKSLDSEMELILLHCFSLFIFHSLFPHSLL